MKRWLVVILAWALAFASILAPMPDCLRITGIGGLQTSLAADWYNENWSNRAEIDIEGNGASTENYSIFLDAYYNCAPLEANGCTEFLNRPAYRYDGTYDRTYMQNAASDGKVTFRYWDEDSLTLSATAELWDFATTDDHNGGSTIVLQYQTGDNATHNGTILCVAADFGVGLYSRRTNPNSGAEQSNPENIANWGVSNTLSSTAAKGYCYPMLIETSEGTIWCFYQGHDTNAYDTTSYQIMTLGADPDDDSWGSQVIFARLTTGWSTYCLPCLSPDGNWIHMAMSVAIAAGPTNYRNVWYAKYDVANTHWEGADGTTDITKAQMEAGGYYGDGTYTPDVVHTTTAVPQHVTMIWSIELDSGEPHILFLDGTAVTEHAVMDVYLATYSAGWSSADTGANSAANLASGAANEYLWGGAVLDPTDTDRMVVSVPDGSNYTQIQAYENVGGTWYIADGNNGTTAVCGDGKITQASPGDNFRPFFVVNGGGLAGTGKFRLLWFFTESYTDTSTWESMRFAYPGFNNSYFIGFGKGCRTDFEDCIFTNSDGTTLLGDEGHPWQQEETDSWRSLMWIGKFTCPADDNTTTLYCYYGKSDETFAPDQATMDAQFLACDHFDETYGDATWAAKWNDTANAVTIDGASSVVLTSVATTMGIFDQDTANYPLFLYAEMRFKFKASDTTPGAYYFIGGRNGATNNERTIVNPGGTANAANQVIVWTDDAGDTPTYEYTTLASQDTANWHVWSAQWVNGSCAFYKDTRYNQTNRLVDTLKATHTTHVSETAQGIYMLEGNQNSTGSVSVDYVFARSLTTEPTITVNTIKASLDIAVTPTTWTAFYKEGAGSSTSNLRENTWYSATNDGDLDYFTVTNNGGSLIDISISSDNWTGSGKTWILSSTATPGNATIGLYAGLEGGSFTIIINAAGDYDLITSLVPDGTQVFSLKILTCTSNGGNVSMSGTVTLTAVVHT